MEFEPMLAWIDRLNWTLWINIYIDAAKWDEFEGNSMGHDWVMHPVYVKIPLYPIFIKFHI